MTTTPGSADSVRRNRPAMRSCRIRCHQYRALISTFAAIVVALVVVPLVFLGIVSVEVLTGRAAYLDYAGYYLKAREGKLPAEPDPVL